MNERPTPVENHRIKGPHARNLHRLAPPPLASRISQRTEADQVVIEEASLLPTCARHKLPTLRCLSRTHPDSRNPGTACTHPPNSPKRRKLTSSERWMCTAAYQRDHQQPRRILSGTNSGNRDSGGEISCSSWWWSSNYGPVEPEGWNSKPSTCG